MVLPDGLRLDDLERLIENGTTRLRCAGSLESPRDECK